MMQRRARNTASMILSTIGVLFILAMAFDVVLPSRVALFIGIACFVLAGLMRRLAATDDDG